MLFLGLGTGLGSALIWETNVLPLEFGDLPYGNGNIIEDYLGKSGMKRFGEKEMETRSPSRRSVVEKVAYCRLRRSRRRQREKIGGTWRMESSWDTIEMLSRWPSPLANRPAHAPAKMENL